MSTSENPFEAEIAASEKVATGQTLRWWPAAVLLMLMGVIKFLPSMMEAPSIPVFMIGFMGPAAICLFILGWWLFASRAARKEKLIGVAGTAVPALVSAILIHPSMQGLDVIFYLIPCGFGLFALALIIFANRPDIRLKVALAAAFVGFGVWNLFQDYGKTGTFSPEFTWRWSPEPGARHMERIAGHSTANPADDADVSSVITKANSEWSDFRGPQRDGRQSGIILEADWKAHPPREVWKSTVGPGWSSFTVAGNRLFTLEQRGDKEAVICLDAETGDFLWVHEYAARFWEAVAGAGPRSTPTIGDEGLFSLGANGDLFCLNPVTGDVIWHRELQADAGTKPPMWGFASSPLIYKGLVVVHAGGPGNKGVLAYDSKSGEPKWSIASGNHSYSSPHLASFDGVEGILMQTNDGLQFLNGETGSLIWQHEWAVENYRVTQPLIIGNSVLMATSLGLGTRRLTVKHEGESWKVTEDWTSLEMKPDFNDYVEYQGNLYGFDGNIFSCVDLTNGKRRWKRGRYGNGQVLLLPDAGQLLVTSETGELILLKADPAEMVELAKIQAIEGKTWNHPVLIGNRLYLRNAEEVACYEMALRPQATANGSQQASR